jgi:type VII secretion protein EccB
MQTRREQVRAYRFVTRRIVSALLSGEPETNDLPMRRLGGALIASVMVGAIVLAGVGAYGLLNPGGGLLDGKALVIERETGARYVYLNNVLYPVLNYASARLALGDAAPAVRTMSRRSLRDLKRGRPIGIPGAPDSVPGADELLSLPWSVCSAPGPDEALPTPQTRLLVGVGLPSGTDPGDRALLIAAPDDAGGTTRYLVWHRHRLKVDGLFALTALHLDASTPLPVGQALVNAIPAGPDLTPYGKGSNQPSGRTLNGKPAVLGQLYHHDTTYYVLLTDGLAPVGQVMADIIRGQKNATPVEEVSQSELTANHSGTTQVEPDGFPRTMPELVSVDQHSATVCAIATGPDLEADSSVRLYDQAPAQLRIEGADTAGRITDGVQAPTTVVVSGGQGALVVDAPGSTVYLITDRGLRYAVPRGAKGGGVDALTALGFGGVAPVTVPGLLLRLIPKGPQLDPDAAMSSDGPDRPADQPDSGQQPSSASPSPHRTTSPSPKPASSSLHPSPSH